MIGIGLENENNWVEMFWVVRQVANGTHFQKYIRILPSISAVIYLFLSRTPQAVRLLLHLLPWYFTMFFCKKWKKKIVWHDRKKIQQKCSTNATNKNSLKKKYFLIVFPLYPNKSEWYFHFFCLIFSGIF